MKQVQAVQQLNIHDNEGMTASLSAEQFGLTIGHIMHQYNFPALPITKNGNAVGALMLSSGSFRGVTMTAVAWGRIPVEEIQQDLAEVDRHGFSIMSGVYGAWDSAGLKQLDHYRNEIMESLFNAIECEGYKQ